MVAENMELVIIEILTIAMGYVIGAIPPSFIFGKLFFGIDIREKGSGNVGGANAARTMGMKVGLTAGILDILKGTLAVFIAVQITAAFPTETGFFANPNWTIALTGLMAIVGHCYSFILRFKGGKGGATTAGVLLMLDPFVFGILVLTWFIIVASTRFTSLGNLIAVLVIPVFFFYRSEEIGIRLSDVSSGLPYIIFSLAISAFIYFTHRENVVRLLGGYERKVGKREG